MQIDEMFNDSEYTVNEQTGSMKAFISDETKLTAKAYTKFDFEREVFGANVSELLDILKYKKNIILQGAPGVGKTHTAKRLAYAMMGCKDDKRVMQVQFHQNYTYDDFVMGLRPTEQGGFKFTSGPFYNICKRAEKDLVEYALPRLRELDFVELYGCDSKQDNKTGIITFNIKDVHPHESTVYYLTKIMWRNIGSHTNSDTGSTIYQKLWKLRRQNSWFL